MSVRNWQQRLRDFGYPIAIDDVAGPQTYGALFAYMGARDIAGELGTAAADLFPRYAITTSLRVAHFIAQAAAETGAFRWLRELWGPTATQIGYEGNRALGNTEPGDGYKYRGRGIFMLTGRANYQDYGQRLGLDLIDRPELAATPGVALRIACLYWSDHRLNDYADADNILGVSNGINRGNPASIREPNGFSERKAELAKAKAVLA